MNVEDLELAVKSGAAWLDRTYPVWQNSIDLDNLDLASPKRCILGQLEGDYNEALDRLGALTPWVAAHGFTVAGEIGGEERVTCWDYLNDAWTRAVEARR